MAETVERLRDLHRACDVADLAGRPLTTDEVRRLAGPVTDLGPAGRTGEGVKGEATYPPDMPPSQLLRLAIDAHRHTRIGGGDPGDLTSFIARWLVEQDYVIRSKIPGPVALAARSVQPAPAEHPGVAELLRLCREWTAAKGDSAVLRCSLIESTLTATTEEADRG